MGAEPRSWVVATSGEVIIKSKSQISFISLTWGGELRGKQASPHDSLLPPVYKEQAHFPLAGSLMQLAGMPSFSYLPPQPLPL